MTSPEGRLRCGRPSAFVPAILPPPINSNFGASPTRFSLSSSRILLPSTRGPSPRLVYAFPLLFLSAQLSLPRLHPAPVLHPAPLSICPIAPCLDGISLIFLPFYLPYILQSSPHSLVVRVRLPIFDSFDPETRQALLCIRNRLNDV